MAGELAAAGEVFDGLQAAVGKPGVAAGEAVAEAALLQASAGVQGEADGLAVGGDQGGEASELLKNCIPCYRFSGYRLYMLT